MSTRTKPPVGPEPEAMWREIRMWHLIELLAPFANQTEHPVHDDWLIELRDRIEEVTQHKKAKR